MSRRRHFTRGLSASWLATLVTVLYGLASVPIALRYLSVEEFGLFMLILQVAGYFSLIELGMAGATARILVDYKDRPNDGVYGSIILTSSMVFFVQAIIIAVVGIIAAPQIISIVGVPPKLADVGIYLLRWLCLTFSLSTGLRVFGSLLYANKRLDLLNAITGATVLLGLALMVVILASGAGLRGLVVMFLMQGGAAVLLHAAACWQLNFLPRKGCWGAPTLQRFRELFTLAKDFFLVSAGNQVLEASQLIIITRTMGLASAAVWSVSTKVFVLLYQLLTKIQGTAVVFLTEMMVRGESQRLQYRFRQIFQITAGLAAVSLAVAVGVNKPFVTAWAKSDLAWAVPLSTLMAALVFLNATSRCHVDLIIHTKNILALRYIYFLEAAAFVSLSLVLAPKVGFYGVLLSALVCLIFARYWYVTLRVARYFNISIHSIVWSWPRRSLLAILFMLPFVLAAQAVVTLVSGPWLQLALATLCVGAPAVVALATIALPKDVTMEVQRHLLQVLPTRKN